MEQTEDEAVQVAAVTQTAEKQTIKRSFNVVALIEEAEESEKRTTDEALAPPPKKSRRIEGEGNN